jgi:hypothetical protein
MAPHHAPHAYSGLGRTCSPKSAHIHTIFAPYSHHIRTHSHGIRTTFAPHSHHIRPLRDGHVWTCLDMAGHGWTCLMDMAGHGWTWLKSCLLGDRTRFVRFAPDSRDSQHIRTVFARIRAYSRKGRSVFTHIRTYSHTFIPIHTCECAKRAPLDSRFSLREVRSLRPATPLCVSQS